MKDLQLTYQGVVYPWHCDHMGHMNVMWYAGKFDEATWNLLSRCGLTLEYFGKEHRGMVAAEQQTVYKRELLAGMTIKITSGVLEVRDKSIKFFHVMRNSETNGIAATTIITGIHIDSAIRVACTLPGNMKNLALELKADESSVDIKHFLNSK